MGVAGGLARHRAQAKALGGVEIGGLEAAVVEDQRLALAVLEVQLAVVGALQRFVDQGLHARAVHAPRGRRRNRRLPFCTHSDTRVAVLDSDSGGEFRQRGHNPKFRVA